MFDWLVILDSYSTVQVARSVKVNNLDQEVKNQLGYKMYCVQQPFGAGLDPIKGGDERRKTGLTAMV